MVHRNPAMLRSLGSLAALCGTLTAVAPVQASVVLSYPGFAGACGTSLTCIGNTAVAGTALRVTPSAGSQSGAGYSTTAITLGANATFSTTFQFQITNAIGIAPADGFTFVVAANATGLGSLGGGLGYAGVANSVAIEFDTFNNGSTPTEPNSNHIGVNLNGSLASQAVATPYGVAPCDFSAGYLKPGCMSNGNIWTATITYDGATQLLDMFLQDGSAAAQHIISGLSIDIGAALGTSTAFVGFTSGTGSGAADHDILNWRLANDTSITGNVPEPGSLALGGLAMAALGLSRRRRG